MVPYDKEHPNAPLFNNTCLDCGFDEDIFAKKLPFEEAFDPENKYNYFTFFY